MRSRGLGSIGQSGDFSKIDDCVFSSGFGASTLNIKKNPLSCRISDQEVSQDLVLPS